MLSADDRERLIRGAFEAKEGAYSPYSGFPVGAALLSSEGQITKGASIDNTIYAANTCAECTAIVKAVSDGIRSFIGLAIVANIEGVISPCGICRQVIREFCPPDMPILLVPGDYLQRPVGGRESKKGYTGGIKETTIDELLPQPFGPEQLELLHKS